MISVLSLLALGPLQRGTYMYINSASHSSDQIQRRSAQRRSTLSTLGSGQTYNDRQLQRRVTIVDPGNTSDI